MRSTLPFVPNGSDPSAFKGSAFSEGAHHHKKHRKPDVAERGMDEEVHGFVSDTLPPLNTRVKSALPFIPNGSDPKAFQGAAFNQRRHSNHQKPDIAERNMDWEVYDFASDNTPPIKETAHSESPPAYNGNKLSQHKHKKHAKAKDMGERGYDEEVYGFAHDLVSAING